MDRQTDNSVAGTLRRVQAPEQGMPPLGLRGRTFHDMWLVSIPQHRLAARLALTPGLLHEEGICHPDVVGV